MDSSNIRLDRQVYFRKSPGILTEQNYEPIRKSSPLKCEANQFDSASNLKKIIKLKEA